VRGGDAKGVPWRVAIGNFKLSGVLLAYLPDAMGKMLKRGMGWSFKDHARDRRAGDRQKR